MNNLSIALLLFIQLLLTACSPIKTSVSNQYKLESFGTCKSMVKAQQSIFVSPPEALAGYQTEQMLYVKKPYGLSSFVHNAWVSSPANMIYPLLLQSLQQTGYFFAVASGSYVDKADYRLDTQILELEQSFLTKPSVVNFVAKITLTKTANQRVIFSRIITNHVPCPKDTPYGGVVAANKAAQSFTTEVAQFVVAEIKHND